MTPAKRNFLDRFLGTVEKVGNFLPHPVTLFFLLAVLTLLISGVGGYFEWFVADPRPEGARGRSADGAIRAISLLNEEGLRKITEGLVRNFVEFAPLGTVLVALLGVSVSEHSGFFAAAIRFLVLGAHRRAVTMMVIFAGVLSNMASEVGYVVIVPLGAAVFYSLGRHPMAGLAAAFAGVSGGYSANLLLGTVDPLLAGITQESARMLDPVYEVHPAVNWYFMAGSTFLVTLLGTWITERLIEPRLGAFDPARAESGLEKNVSMEPLRAEEKAGLAWAAASMLMVSLGIVYLAGPGMKGAFSEALSRWPLYGALRDPGTGDLLRSPLLRGVVTIIFVFFIVPGCAYGWRVKTIRSDRDIIHGMSKTMSDLGGYIVLVFFAAQFVKFFEWTNLGPMLAVVGANAIAAMRLDNALVFAPFIVICGTINLLMGSASAKWAVLAPIFVPMLMLVGYSPEVIQAAFRIGDSSTNVVTPMMSYFGIIYAFAARYDQRLGMGTLISLMLPYAILFGIGWTLFFYLWVFVLGIPVGPGAPLHYPPG